MRVHSSLIYRRRSRKFNNGMLKDNHPCGNFSAKMIRVILALVLIILPVSISNHQALPLTIPQDPDTKKFLYDVSLSKVNDIDAAILKLESLRGDLREIDDYFIYFIIRLCLKKGDLKNAYEYLNQFDEIHKKSILKGKVNLAFAKRLYEDGRYDEAHRFVKSALESWLGKSKPEAMLLEGLILEGMGNLKGAVKSYYRLRESFPLFAQDQIARKRIMLIKKKKDISIYPSTDEYLYREGSLLMKERQFEEAAKNLDRLIKRFSKSKFLKDAKFKRAELYLLMGESKKALEEFIRIKNEYTGEQVAAESIIRAIRILWKEDSTDSVRALAQELFNNYPDTPLSERAIYILGRLFEEEGKWGEAASLYEKTLDQITNGSLREQFIKRIAWCYYIKGDYSRSSDIFNEISIKYPHLKEYGLYWKARSLEKMGNIEEAGKIFNILANLPFPSYYGVLSLKKLGKHPTCNGKISSRQTRPGNALNEVKNPLLIRAMILSEILLLPECEEELDLIERDTLNPKEMLELSWLYKKINLPHKSIKIASSIERELRGLDSLSIPYSELDTLLFPLEYAEDISRNSLKMGFDPLLIASIIRQESAFDPNAVSRSNAIGLMQIIPKTGFLLAKKTGISQFTSDMLYNPSLNLELGIFYLKMLSTRFNGDMIKVLAAYNAGENAVERWWRRFSNLDHDEIVENLPYSETENYIKNIIRNQYHYTRIYCESPPMVSPQDLQP